MNFLLQTINVLADLLIMLIFLRIIFSWFSRRETRVSRFLKEATEPILSPIRRALPRMGMLDLSPIVAYFAIEILRSILNSFLIQYLV